jgi:hypothetical protein
MHVETAPPAPAGSAPQAAAPPTPVSVLAPVPAVAPTATPATTAAGGAVQLAQQPGLGGTQSGLEDLYVAGQQLAWAGTQGTVNGAPGGVAEWGAHSWGGVAAGGVQVNQAQVQAKLASTYAKLSPAQQAQLNLNDNQFQNALGAANAPEKDGWTAAAAGQHAQQTPAWDTAGLPQLTGAAQSAYLEPLVPAAAG